MREIERAAVKADKSDKSEKADAAPDTSTFDDMLPAAADMILESGQASTSMIQSRLRLGFARARRIIDQLEQIGLLGPNEGSKPRQILLTRDQWREMQLISGIAPTGRAARPESVFPYDESVTDEYSDDDAPF
jgi:S-DNA-T family DNA segregation ATPase FtsK/SpoIIIE